MGNNSCNYSFGFNGNISSLVSQEKIIMNLASILENPNLEKRVAITPEIAKKYISLGFNLTLPKNYATHIGFGDEDYKSLGVNFLDNEKEIINNSEIIIQIGLPDKEKLALLKENQTLIGSLNAFLNKEELEESKVKENKLFFTRITSKDYKSSINGYFIITS